MATTTGPTLTPDSDPDQRVVAWEARTEWPLGGLAALFLIAYAWPILDEGIPHGWHRVCDYVGYSVWLAFAADYVIRIYLATHRVHYIGHHIPDLVVIALPVLRPLRLLRLVMLLRVLNKGATDSLRGRIAIYVTGSTILLLFCAALAVLDSERHQPGSNITTFGDALWWAVTTITTVGYGDHYPITTQGRFIAVGLMIGGIALLGVVTASIASWLIDRVREEDQAAQNITRADIAALRDQISDLQAQLRDAAHDTPRPARPPIPQVDLID